MVLNKINYNHEFSNIDVIENFSNNKIAIVFDVNYNKKMLILL